MRVALVSAVTTHHRDSDRTRRVESLAQRLRERDHDVIVVCARWWDGSHPLFEADGLTYRGVADDPDTREFPASVPSALSAFDPDVVHAVGDRPTHLLAARVGATLTRAPLVADWWEIPDVEGNGVAGAVSRWTFELAIRSPTVHVAPSRTVKTALRAAGAPADQIEVIPDGVDFDRVRSVEPGDCGEVVYSRELDADANLESLLLALAEFREQDWTATVVGDGPERSRYEDQARDLRIDDRVSFAGDLPVEERLALFRDAHVYVHTARRTPFPTDLLRALACGCVAIVEYHEESSAHELVEQDPRCFLVTSDTELVDALASAGDLERLDVDDSFAAYDMDEVADTYLELYDDAMADHGLL